MKALVTGSEGFIGTHLCRILREDGHEVIGFDLKNGNDVVDCALPGDVDRVFHLAAQTDARSVDALRDARNNIMSAVRVMQLYKEKVTFSSSSAVNYVGSPYSISKLACEHYAKLFGCGIVRFCNIHGPGSKSFIDLYQCKEYVNAYLPGTQLRTYAHVEAACEELLLCKAGKLRILGGENLTVKDVIEIYYPGKKVHWFAPKKYDVIEGRQVNAV
jgi:nucleoside-diphosphate-sugar epimerase